MTPAMSPPETCEQNLYHPQLNWLKSRTPGLAYRAAQGHAGERDRKAGELYAGEVLGPTDLSARWRLQPSTDREISLRRTH
jgi:hypothetical protein